MFFRRNDPNKIILREGSRNIVFWATLGYLLAFVGSVLLLISLISVNNEALPYLFLTSALFIVTGVISLIIKNLSIKSKRLIKLDVMFIAFYVVLALLLGFLFVKVGMTTLGRLESVIIAFTFYPAYKALLIELKRELMA